MNFENSNVLNFEDVMHYLQLFKIIFHFKSLENENVKNSTIFEKFVNIFEILLFTIF